MYRYLFFPPTETAETVINDMFFITVIVTFCLPVMWLSSVCVVIHLSLQSKALHQWIKEEGKTGVCCRFEQVEGSVKSDDEVMLLREVSWPRVLRFFALSWDSIWFDDLYLFILDHIYLNCVSFWLSVYHRATCKCLVKSFNPIQVHSQAKVTIITVPLTPARSHSAVLIWILI